MGEDVAYLATQYLFGDDDAAGPGPAVSSVSGALSQPGRPFTHGFEIYLEQATIAFEFATLGGQGHVSTPLSVLTADGGVEHPRLGSGDPIDAFTAELQDAVDAVSSGTVPTGLTAELAAAALEDRAGRDRKRQIR